MSYGRVEQMSKYHKKPSTYKRRSKAYIHRRERQRARLEPESAPAYKQYFYWED